jgi:hypothetical protein
MEDNLPELKEDEFRAFLQLKNNRHWRSLQRLGPMMCSDMDAPRDGLITLLHGTYDLATRYDEGVGRVKGVGKATATALLHELANRLGVSLWILDGVWWGLQKMT